MLDEIIRQAEIRLDAQLTAAIAADQRAMTFAGLLFAGAAAVAAIAFGNTTLLKQDWPWVLAIGFAIAGAMATASARPSAWEYVGNVPSAWLGDIGLGKRLHESRAETAEFYDEMLATNETVIRKSGRLMQYSMLVAILAIIGGLMLLAASISYRSQ